jgi:NADH-quinone oxidoreductase subunit C
MTFQEIYQTLLARFGEKILGAQEDIPQPCIVLQAEALPEIAEYLHSREGLYFDMLSCLTALDNGPEADSMEVIYHLYSIPYHHHLVLKVFLPRHTATQILPQIPSVSGIWRTANWHEREAFDLLGIDFTGHPDLRRILLPADWEGYPLRKDYNTKERYYRGMSIDYDREQSEEKS